MYENPILYEINTLVWLGELSRACGRSVKLEEVPSEQWDRLQRLGFDSVWLMGIWKRSREGMRLFRESPEWPKLRAYLDLILPRWADDDLIGSPYSIASFTPEPLIGTWDGLDRTHDELRKRGMKLILDFVPNHTAPDHPWVLDHPDYYIRRSEEDFRRSPESCFPVYKKGKRFFIARGKDPYFPPWPDSAQLNYFNPALRSAMVDELKKIASHCDGVRCDMAMLVLNDIFAKNWQWAGKDSAYEAPTTEFWTEARRVTPGFVLIAEAYWDTERMLQQLGFDYTYDKGFYDRLRSASAREVSLHLTADLSYQKRLVRFIENHDEPRSADVFGKERLRAAAVLFSTLPGMKLFHHGQLAGRRIHVPMMLRRVKDEIPDGAIKAFYEKLLSIIRSEVFQSGEWELKEAVSAGDDGFRNFVVYRWKLGARIKLVVVNFEEGYARGRIFLNKELAGDYDFVLFDELNDQRYIRNGKDMRDPGLYVALEGFRAHIFDISPKS